MNIDFFFDFASPYSYLANTQLDIFAAEHAVTFTRRPVLLGAVFKETGNQMPALLPAKGKYMGQDLPRIASVFGVPLRWPKEFPVPSIGLLRATMAVRSEAPAALSRFIEVAFAACWAESRDLKDAATLSEIAQKAAVPEALVLQANASQVCKDALRMETEAAVAAGCFGAPTFAVGKELFFGVESLPLLAERVRRGAPFPTFDREPEIGGH